MSDGILFLKLATEILELLLDEDEDVPDVWYMLGWANYLQGPDFVVNARHYLTKAKKVEKLCYVYFNFCWFFSKFFLNTSSFLFYFPLNPR